MRVRGPLASDNSLALRAALVAGLGLALTPEFVVEDDLASGRLSRCLGDWEPEAHQVFAIVPGARLPSAKVRAFVDFARDSLGEAPKSRPPARRKR